MDNFILGAISGALIVGLMALGALHTLDKQVDDATDRVQRIELQYHDCMMIGDYPTNADMLPGDSKQ